MPPSNMPDPTSSIASSPWVNQVDQDFGGPSSTLGSNHLQSSIDKLTAAVNKLSKAMGPGGGKASGNGGLGGVPGGPATHANGGYGAGFGGMIKQSFGSSTGMSAAKVGGAFAVAAAFGSYGKQQMPAQIGMSSFVQRQALMGAPVGMSAQAVGNAVRFGTYGGNGQNLNSGALNATDATQGGSILGAVTGSWNPRTTSFGRTAMGAANLYGYANPGQGYAASAQMAATQYNPQTSMAMMQSGMAPALNRAGGQQSAAAIFRGFSQRQFGGRSTVDPKSLAWAMRSGSVGDVNFQGIYGQQAPQFEAAYAATNALMFGNGKNARGMSAAAADKLMNQASRGTSAQMKAAQATLSKYNVSQTDQRLIQNKGAVDTGRSSDVANSFNAGLSAATDGLTRFNDVLTKIINSVPGVNLAVGGGGGLAGGLSSLSNPKNIMQGVGGAAAMMGVAGGLGRAVTSRLGAGLGSAVSMSAAIAAGATPVWVVGNSASGLGGSGGILSKAGALKALGGGGAAAGESGAAAGALGASAGAVAAAAVAAALLIGIDVALITHKTTAADRAASKSVKHTMNSMPASSRPAAGRYLNSAAIAFPGGASGGVVSGQDMGHDSQLIAVRGQEAILVPGATRAMGGPAGIDAINRRYGGGGKNIGGHYAQGGVAPLAPVGSASDINEAHNIAGALGGGGSMSTTPSSGGASSSGGRASSGSGGSSSGGGSSATGPLTTAMGGMPGNASIIGKYLMSHGFSRIEAAGVLGNIMGEDSSGSPETTEAGGGGGQGLIQWTGHGNMITGNYQADMASQLKALLSFGGGASSMKGAKSPAEAASMYLMNVERPANPSASSALREASANASYKAGYAGGTSGAAPGWAAVGENGMEMVNMRGGEQVLNHAATMASKHSGRGYAGGTGTITFGDIHIHYGGSPSDAGAASHNARETVRAIRVELAREDLVDQIASGVTH